MESPAHSNLLFTSTLDPEDFEDLEQLFYFNPNQWKMRKSVEAAVQRYGTPEIIKSRDRIQLILAGIEQSQVLYLYVPGRKNTLAGVVVYIREDVALKVLFWGLRNEYTADHRPEAGALLRIVEELRRVGRRIVGVKFLTFQLGEREFRLTI